MAITDDLDQVIDSLSLCQQKKERGGDLSYVNRRFSLQHQHYKVGYH